MPKDEETKNTKGYAFVEFNSPEASQHIHPIYWNA